MAGPRRSSKSVVGAEAVSRAFALRAVESRIIEYVLRAIGDELGADSPADGDGLAPRTTRVAAHDSAAVEREDHSHELEAVVIER